jgi:hypothetical protein
MGLCFGENTMYYLVFTFSITYLKVHVHANTEGCWLRLPCTSCGAYRGRRLVLDVR